MVPHTLKNYAAYIAVVAVLGSNICLAGQVPVVRPSNLGVSSPTLPSGSIAVSGSAVTSAPTSAVGVTATVGSVTEMSSNNKDGLTGFASSTLIGSTIEQLEQVTSGSNLTITSAQRAGITRTIESVLVNVEMTPSQRAQLINVREQLEHQKR